MKKLLLKQISGIDLKFRPNNSIGFTTGNNFIILTIQNYIPNNINVSLSFFSNKPIPTAFGEFNSSFVINEPDIDITDQTTVNQVIEEHTVVKAIAYLKTFNPTCDFEEDSF